MNLAIDADQALGFRLGRHHLQGPGAPDAATAARAIVGIQAQEASAAAWSLATRLGAPPTAADARGLFETSTAVVRTWGQRDTVHVYDTAHWPLVIACLPGWRIGARAGLEVAPGLIERARARILELGRPVARSDLFDLLPDAFVEEMAARTGPGVPAQRGAAGRLVWALAREGMLAAGPQVGREQSYVLREQRYADLGWGPVDPRAATDALVDAYLAANAPASAHDIAHFFGMRVPDARASLERLAPSLVPVVCDGVDGLFARAVDADALRAAAPDGPPRLLARFDTWLMSHANKALTQPNDAERAEVWAKAAEVRAVVLDRGRVVGVWKPELKRGALTVRVRPLTGWSPRLADALAPDLARYAAHTGARSAAIAVGSPG